jgi:fluoride ion exporter CrcB/FEX
VAFAAEMLLTLVGAGLGAVLRYALGGWAKFDTNSS